MNLRSTLLSAAFALAATGAFAQQASESRAFYNTSYKTRNSGSFSLNHRLFSVSYGFPTALNDGFGYGRIGFGPVMARFEAPIRDEVGIAGLAQIGARSSGGFYDDHSFAFGFGGMGFYHFNKLIPVRDLDVYAGLGIAINFTHVNREGNRKDDNYVDPMPIGSIGARYYFSPGFAGFAEAGFTGMSSVNLGLTWRL